jgi:MFS family permease
MILSPLAADMFCIVEQMGKDNEGLFGPAGVYAQAYGLFDTALALGTMFGPTYAGLLYEKVGWSAAVWALAAFCASGSIPIVSAFPSFVAFGKINALFEHLVVALI